MFVFKIHPRGFGDSHKCLGFGFDQAWVSIPATLCDTGQVHSDLSRPAFLLWKMGIIIVVRNEWDNPWEAFGMGPGTGYVPRKCPLLIYFIDPIRCSQFFFSILTSLKSVCFLKWMVFHGLIGGIFFLLSGGALWAIAHGVAKSRTWLKLLSVQRSIQDVRYRPMGINTIW